MFLETLPAELENAEALIKRRSRAGDVKERWRSTYQEAYRYAMPTRETFTWETEGQDKQRQLYDSTLQEATYTAANTMCAVLFPSWTRWAEYSPGGAVPDDHPLRSDIIRGLQDATQTTFSFLHNSNFSTVISEAAQDLLVGTCSLDIDEGPDNDQPFLVTSIPLSAIEIEEGPQGTVETTWMPRKVKARNIERLYPGLSIFDLSAGTQDAVVSQPDKDIDVIEGKIYLPRTKHYYGVVIEVAAKHIIWRYDYGTSCPRIVARATKVAGETYGRGRILLALADAKTLDRMQEFVLRHAALQIAPPLTGVSDGILNPYTATLAPNTIIPVASNDSGAPSLRALDIGGNFQISEVLMDRLRQRIRRTMIGPEPSEGAVRSATENQINDRNRLWAMNGEFNRIQAELLAKVMVRCAFILQKKGIIPKFKIDGREVVLTYSSPFTKSQNSEDVVAFTEAMQVAALAGPENVQRRIKVEDAPAWIARMKGVPEKLIRNDDELMEFDEKVASAVEMAAQATPEEQEMMGAQ